MNYLFRNGIKVAVALLLAALGNSARAGVEQDIALCYAPSYAASVGGEANAQVNLANAATGVNYLYDQSGAGARWHIAGYYQSANDLANATTTGGMVGWLANNDSRVADVVNFGNTIGADLLCYVVQNSNDGAAAVAQEPGMYSVVNPPYVWFVIFAHEGGGHNYGAHHGDGHLNPKTIMMHNYCGGGAAPPYFYSSPNIWFNGVQLLGDGSSCLGDGNPNGGDNAWRICSSAQSVSDTRARPVFAPVLDHMVLRWQFTNAPGAAPASTSVADKISSAPAVVRGNGATFTGSALRIPGGTTGNVAANSMAAYIDLPNGILSSRTNLTIEIWATPLSAQNWGRILDFGRTDTAGDGLGAPGEWTGTPGTAATGTTSGRDELLLSEAIGTDLTQQRFEARNDGGTQITTDSGVPTTAGVQHHYTITFTDGAGSYGSAGGRWQWYRDGEPIAYLDANFHLSAIEDVDNWLGRSLWSGDAIANNDYAEVRISDVALSPQQVKANFLLGPNYNTAGTVTMTANDAIGSTSFNAPGHWSSGLAPSAGNRYETFDFQLRTPATSSAYIFGGDALTLSGGDLVWKGTTSSSVTVNDFRLNNASVINAGSGTMTLAGNLTTTNGGLLRAANGPINITADLKGNGPLNYLANTVTLSGNNSAFTGKTMVGSGSPGGLSISSEAQLGANPASFIADQLTLNRGWFYTATTMAIDDSNRGIQIGVSGGIFNVASGTTLTIANPISSPPVPANVLAGLLIKESSGTLALTSPNNSHGGGIVINGGTLTVSGGGRLGNGTYPGAIANNSSFIFNSSAAQILSGVISGAGAFTKSGAGMLTLSAANTMSGAVTVNAGTLYANPGNSASNRTFSYVSAITVNNGGTLRSGVNGLFGFDGTQEHSITVNTGGILTSDAGADVGVSTITLAGGTLANLGASGTWGSWRFDQATDKLVVTQDSTASAINVKFANGAAIDVASGRTLNFTGTITDTTSGGASSVVKSGGAGTLVLAGVNTYTGTTAINAGTVLVNGSLGNSAVTIGSSSTLGGNGTVNGAITAQSGGTLSPGASIGRLTVNNSVTLQDGSTLLMEIDKSAQTNDVLRVTGTLNCGGTLTVNNLGGTLTAGDNFHLVDANATAGAFTATNLPPLGGGLAWNFDSAAGVLSVVATAAPNLLLTQNGTNINLSWPVDHLGWRLQVQINPAPLGLGTNWVDVPNSTNVTQMVLPVDPQNGSVFYRLIYP